MHNRQAPYSHTWYLNTSLFYFKHVQVNLVQETKTVFRRAASLKCPPQILTLYRNSEGTPGTKSTLGLWGTPWANVLGKLVEKVLVETGQNRYFWESTCVHVCEIKGQSWAEGKREETKERAKKEKQMTLEIILLPFCMCHWARNSFAFPVDTVFSFSLHHKFSQLN